MVLALVGAKLLTAEPLGGNGGVGSGGKASPGAEVRARERVRSSTRPDLNLSDPQS